MIESFTLARLFVLGVLTGGDHHGYEIIATAERWAVHRWSGISIGSIYNALKKLAKEGHVILQRVEAEGNRPDRQIWQISPTGRILARTYVEYGLSSLNYEGREIDMALAFAHLVPNEIRLARLQQRLGPMGERLHQLNYFHTSYETCEIDESDHLAEFRRLKRGYPWIAASVAHGLGRLQLEVAWTERLISEISTWPVDPITQGASN
jgi:DNA-binding PadR family transcriptional regulator